MDIKVKMTMRGLFCGVALMAMICFSGVSAAEEVAYEVPEGAVSVYGQTLNPHLIETPPSQYSWGQLKDLMPMILPDAQKSTKAAAVVCEEMISLYSEYGIKLEEAEYKLFDSYEGPDGVDPFPGEDYAVAVSSRVGSPDPEARMQLLEVFPKLDLEILDIMHEFSKEYMAVLYLHDAALANCADYAKEKEYYMILNYNGPDADYDPDSPEEKAAWDALEKE